MKPMSVLISGIDGFSASNVKKFLHKSKINSLGISRRYKKKKIIKWDLIKKNNRKIKLKIDWIIHIAAIHKIQDFLKNNNNKRKNILMTKNLIEFAKKNHIKKFIFFSTIDISNDKVFGNKRDYNLSKLKSEELILKAYKKKIFEKVIILRIPAILGKNANQNFLINTIKKLKKNKDIIIKDRSKYNNFVHIDDLSKLILNIINYCNTNKSKNSRFYNILNCLCSNYIHISKKILEIKKKLNSNSKIFLTTNRDNLKFITVKKNKFNFKFMSCNKAIKLIL